MAVQQYEAITSRTLRQSKQTVYQRRLAALTMMTVVQEQRPVRDEWPFVFVERFETIVTPLLQSSSGAEMGFIPLVPIGQLSEWEDFAYEYLHRTRKPSPFPNTTAVSSFGKGVWAIDPTLPNTTDQRYHDTTGVTTYNSSYSGRFVTPIFHANDGPSPFLLLNVHFNDSRGHAVDTVIDCSRRMKQTNVTSTEFHRCGVLTKQMSIVVHHGRPGASIVQPIYPLDDPWELVGFLPTVLLYDEVLSRLFTDTTSGLYCVLSVTDQYGHTQYSTYTVTNGMPQYL
jgi:hypothetical protein